MDNQRLAGPSRMTSIDEYLRLVRARSKRPFSTSTVTADVVREAESALGRPLPPSYHTLVASCCPDDLPHWLYWLGRDLAPGQDLLRINGSVPLPPFLIAVCGEGGGDEFCFDTRHRDEAGEYRIVRWDHEIQGE